MNTTMKESNAVKVQYYLINLMIEREEARNINERYILEEKIMNVMSGTNY
jgi:hypothetical protein